MNGNRIVDAGLDSPLGQEVAQSVAVRGANDEEVIDVRGVGSTALKRQIADSFQRGRVALGMSHTRGVPLWQVSQLDRQERCLQSVESGVDSFDDVFVLLPFAVVA